MAEVVACSFCRTHYDAPSGKPTACPSCGVINTPPKRRESQSGARPPARSKLPRLAKIPLRAVLVVAFVAVGMIYGLASDSEDQTSVPTTRPTPTPRGPLQLQIVASNLRFDQQSITVRADVELAVVFYNRDEGVMHNVAFYTNRTATERIAVGKIVGGGPSPYLAYLLFRAPWRPGNYFFRCDVHPDMNGTFVVN